MPKPLSKTRLRAAWAVAVGMDALQIFLFPATVEGGLSPVADGLDVVAMALLWALVGWHWAFLPSMVVKVVPFMDLAPTWSIALAIATRGHGAEVQAEPGAPKVINPEILPPEKP